MKRYLLIALLGCCTSLIYAQVPIHITGTIKLVDSFASKYVPARTIAVWLPEDYDSTKKYPVSVYARWSELIRQYRKLES
jgi:hypothetical protein